MDHCAAHSFPTLDVLCAEHGIIVCPLPPQSSNQTQPLGLPTFGIVQRFFARANRMEAINIQSVYIEQVASAFISAAAPLNIVASSRNAGIDLEIAKGEFAYLFPALSPFFN
jgi:hypothetical protein